MCISKFLHRFPLAQLCYTGSRFLTKENVQWIHYANRIQGNVTVTRAKRENIVNRISKHRPVVQILGRVRLRIGRITVVVGRTLISSSFIGRPSSLMMKISDGFFLCRNQPCELNLSDNSLKYRVIQPTRPVDLFKGEFVDRLLTGCTPSKGTSKVFCVCAPRWLVTTTSFCLVIKVKCLQMGQIILSRVMTPSLLMLTKVRTRQSWQNVWEQLRVLAVPVRLSKQIGQSVSGALTPDFSSSILSVRPNVKLAMPPEWLRRDAYGNLSWDRVASSPLAFYGWVALGWRRIRTPYSATACRRLLG